MIRKNTPKKEVLKIAENCKGCGTCCTHDGCFVLSEETDKIAQYLDMDPDNFKEKFLKNIDMFHTNLFKTLNVEGCIFLEDNKCSIHDVKPMHCRIGSCNEHGESLIEWYYLNYLVNTDDPESIRQWNTRLKFKKTISGGNSHELVKDKKSISKSRDCTTNKIRKCTKKRND